MHAVSYPLRGQKCKDLCGFPAIPCNATESIVYCFVSGRPLVQIRLGALAFSIVCRDETAARQSDVPRSGLPLAGGIRACLDTHVDGPRVRWVLSEPSRNGRVQSYVRPSEGVSMTAGSDGVRWSGLHQNCALRCALTSSGLPDLWLDCSPSRPFHHRLLNGLAASMPVARKLASPRNHPGASSPPRRCGRSCWPARP